MRQPSDTETKWPGVVLICAVPISGCLLLSSCLFMPSQKPVAAVLPVQVVPVAALQRAEAKGYAAGLAAGKRIQAHRDILMQIELAAKPAPPTKILQPAPAATPPPVSSPAALPPTVPAVPTVVATPGSNEFNAGGPASPLVRLPDPF